MLQTLGALIPWAAIAAALWSLAKSFIIDWKRSANAQELERLKTALKVESENRKAAQEYLQTQHGWLYKERAKAMSDIYACLVAAHRAFRELMMYWSEPVGGSPSELWEVARTTLDAFRQAYEPKKLFFPLDIQVDLDDYDRAFANIIYLYNSQLIKHKSDELKAAGALVDMGVLTKLPDHLVALEKAFAKLYEPTPIVS